MYKRFLPRAKKLVQDENLNFVLFDVGARNGIWELRDFADRTDAYGFEPNPDEYKKLVTNTINPLKFGHVPPVYKNIRYTQCALSNQAGRMQFYVTPNPAAGGLLEPDLTRLNEIAYKAREYKESFGKTFFADPKVIDVDVRTVQDFAKEHTIGFIDLIKVDVEGSEYEVLEGAGEMLKHTGVVKVETCFIPFRKNQKLFSHLDILLRGYGFDLLRYEVEQMQVGYKQRTKPVDYLPQNGTYSDPYGQPLSCDAIYVNRTITDRKQLLSQAMVLLAKNYVDEALFILNTKVHLSDIDFLTDLKNYSDDSILELLRTYKQEGGRAGRRFRNLAYKAADGFINTLGRIASLIR